MALGGLALALLVIFVFAQSSRQNPATPAAGETSTPATAAGEGTSEAGGAAAEGTSEAGEAALEGTAPPAETVEATAPPAETPESDATAEPAAAAGESSESIQRNYDAPPAMVIDTSKQYRATITTEKGDIVVELDPEAAPQTVNNFVFLAQNNFYDGLTFHRVEPNFVIQGGDPEGTGQGGPGYTLPAEIGLTHDEGALAMARLPDQVNPERESSGSQFYITLAPTPHLDGGYTVFGQVLEGMDVVQSIEIGDVIDDVTIEEQ
ncbi:MAG TPA: peptidylprolyl isomerase [Ardenticatenaceae bacterium]|nr:peptidylprolyl isomerase [Ardenticatenaceae bacterium]